jgi:hypothetical protein
MMIYRRVSNERAEWSGVQYKEKRTKNRTLRNTIEKLIDRRLSTIEFDPE